MREGKAVFALAMWLGALLLMAPRKSIVVSSCAKCVDADPHIFIMRHSPVKSLRVGLQCGVSCCRLGLTSLCVREIKNPLR